MTNSWCCLVIGIGKIFILDYLIFLKTDYRLRIDYEVLISFTTKKNIKSVYIRNINGQKINKDIHELVIIQIINLFAYLRVFSRVYKLDYRVLKL